MVSVTSAKALKLPLPRKHNRPRLASDHANVKFGPSPPEYQETMFFLVARDSTGTLELRAIGYSGICVPERMQRKRGSGGVRPRMHVLFSISM